MPGLSWESYLLFDIFEQAYLDVLLRVPCAALCISAMQGSLQDGQESSAHVECFCKLSQAPESLLRLPLGSLTINKLFQNCRTFLAFTLLCLPCRI